MPIIDDLRPDVTPLDPAWSHQTLTAILQTPGEAPSPMRSRRLRAGLALTTGAIVLAGGGTYAGGWSPAFVTEAFSSLDRQDPGAFDVTGVKPIADFTLPDGTAIEVWRGQNKDGGSCEVLRRTRADESPEPNPGASCFSGDSASHYETVSFGWSQEFDETDDPHGDVHFYAYGESPEASATAVRITGFGTDAPGGSPQRGNQTAISLPVDPMTGGFGGTLPGLDPAAWHVLNYEFTDAKGATVATVQRG